MRKRSGAFHSQTEQQFLQLAQLSHEKTGYFYDEVVHLEVSRKLKKADIKVAPQQEKYCPFKGFQFSVEDLFKQQQRRELQTKVKTLVLSIVLICNNQSDMRQILLELWHRKEDSEAESPQIRQIDLFIVKIPGQGGVIRCFKFWIIRAQQVANPMLHSYFKRACKVLNFSEQEGRGEVHCLSKAKEVLSQIVLTFNY